MRFLGIILSLLGYTLVYASIANHGRFAADPWKGLVMDAYTDKIIGQPAPPQTTTG